MSTWYEDKQKIKAKSASKETTWYEDKAKIRGLEIETESVPNKGMLSANVNGIAHYEPKKAEAVGTSQSPITVDPDVVKKAQKERYKTPAITSAEDLTKYAAKGAEKLEDDEIKIGGMEVKFGFSRYDNMEKYMTESQKQMYQYWIGKGNKKNAEKYLKSIASSTNRKRVDQQQRELRDITRNSKIAGTTTDLVANFAAPLGYVSTMKSFLTGEEIDPNSRAFTAAHTAEAVEGELFEKATPLQQFLGQTGLSTLKYATALMFGQAGALAVMSSGAGGNAAYEAIKRGASTEEAAALGTITGITEYLTEKLPLDHLFRIAKSNVNLISKSGVKQVLAQAGMEGSEEVVSQYVEALADIALMGNRSRYDMYKEQLIAEGMSPAEAEQKARIKSFIIDPAVSFAGGALMGGALGAGAAGVATYKVSQTGSTMRGLGVEQDIIDTGLASEPGTKSNENAMRVSDIMKAGGKVSNFDIGNLYYENVEAINGENDKAQRLGIKSILIEKNVEEADAEKLSVVMQKAFSGDPLSNTEAEAIITNEAASNLFSSMTGYRIEGDTLSQMRKSVKQFSADVVTGKAEPVYVDPEEDWTGGLAAPVERNNEPVGVNVPVKEAVAGKPILEGEEFRAETPVRAYTRVDVKKRIDKLGPAGAKSFAINYKGRNDLENYTGAFSVYYMAGRTGLPLTEADQAYGQYNSVISEDVKFSAYSAGKNDATAELEKRKADAKAAKGKREEAPGVGGEIELEKSAVKAMDALGKATGTKIELVDSIEVNGKKGAANGFYKDGVVRIARDAENPLFVVAKHEITHRLQETAPAEYEEYKNYVANLMAEKGTLEENVKRIDALYQKNGTGLNYSGILDEIAADFTEQIMTDEAAFADLVSENRNIAQKLADLLKAFLEKLTGVIRGGETGSSYGLDAESLRKAEEMWIKALSASGKETSIGKTVPKYSVKVSDKTTKAVEYFGVTNDFREAGYLAQDGKLLDFSGKKESGVPGVRWMDHRDVQDVFEDAAGTDAMNRFMADGNIRIMAELPGLDMNASTTPTEKQIAVIKKYVDQQANDGYFAVDFSDEEGRSIAHLEYENKINPAKIVSDINYFYENGKTPRVSDLDQFRYSLKEDESGKYAAIDTGQDLFEGKPEREYAKIAKDYILRFYRGATLPIGEGEYDFAGVNKRTAEEYTHPARTMAAQEYNMKMRAAPGLEEILEAAVYEKSANDDGRHNVAAMGWDYYRTRFEVDGIHFTGLLNVANSASNRILYDITSIEKELPNSGHYGSPMLLDSSTSGKPSSKDNISNPDAEVNKDSGNQSAEDPDIRYSLKGETEILKENARLKEMNDLLREQFKVASEVTVDVKKTEAYAKSLLKEYSSYYEKESLSKSLTELYNSMSGDYVDYDDAHVKAMGIAYKVLDSASVVNNEMYLEYRNLIQRVRNTPLKVSEIDKKEVAFSAGDYNEFRKKNMGIMRLVNMEYEGALHVDDFYQSLVDDHPELFDEEIANQGEQLLRIRDVVKSLQPFEENPFEGHIQEAVEYLAYDILDQFYEIPQSRATFAEKQQGKLTKEKIKAAEQRKALRERQKERIEEIKKQNREKIQTAISAEKEARNKKIIALKEHYKQKETKRTDSISKRNMRMRIQKIIKDLNQKMLDPTDSKHVPDALKRPVAEFIASLDFTTNRQMEGTRNKLARLQNAYLKIAAGMSQGDADFYLDIDPDVIQAISDLSESIGDKRVVDMNAEELANLYKVARSVRTTVSNYNTLLADGMRQDVFYKGESAIMELGTKNPKNESGYGAVRAAEWMVNSGMLAPADYFEQLGSTMNELYANLRRGLDKKVENTRIATDYMNNLLKDKEVEQWTGDKAKTRAYRLANGKTIELTPAQVMSLYLLSKRQQAEDHIYIGGIKHAPITKKVKGKITVVKAFEPAKVIPADVGNIISTLSKEQREVADGISKFLNTYTSDWGNEVSLKLYGYRKFNELNYFPIKSDDNYLVSEYGTMQDPSLKSKGWTKATTRKANNPIILEDVFDVFTRMADESSSYNAFVIPVSDIKKVMNYRGITSSVKQSIEKKFGKDALRYLDKLMIDIQGGIRTDVGAEKLSKLLANYKAAQMGLNLRVIVQQPTALIRASAMIDPKYLAKGMSKKGDWNKVIKYSPIAQWKSWGYFSMDIGRQMKDIFIGKKQVRDKFFWLIQQADNMAWGKLWNAVEYEVKDTNPELAEGTPPFYEVVAKRFGEVVDRTQVVDTVLHRTDVQRSSDTMMKVYTSFMGEPLKSYNMLRTAAVRYREGKDPEAKKKLARTCVAWAASAGVNAMIVSLVDVYRNSDDEEEFMEQYLKSLAGNAGNDITGMFPVVKDIVSIANGFAPKRMELEGMKDIVYAGKRFGKYLAAKVKGEQPEATLPYVMMDNLVAVSKLIGAPVGNVRREIEALVKNSLQWTNSTELEYAFAKVFRNINSAENRSGYVDLLYRAIQDGEMEVAKRMYNDMLLNGVQKDYIQNGIKLRMRKTLQDTKEVKDMQGIVQKWEKMPKEKRTEEVKAAMNKELREKLDTLVKLGYSEEEIAGAIKKVKGPKAVPRMKDLVKAYEEALQDEGKQKEFYELYNRMIDAGYEEEDIVAAIEASKKMPE